MLFALGACGRRGFDLVHDASPPADASPDGSAPRCSSTARFGVPSLVPGAQLHTGDFEFQPRLSPDERTMYFVRGDDMDVLDVFVATRASADAAFEPPVRVADLSVSGVREYYPAITGDGRTMYLSISDDVYVATRPDATGAFTPPTRVDSVSSSGQSDSGTYVLPDGSALYFSRGSSIYRAMRTATGLAAPEIVAGLDGLGALAPVVSADELTIYFLRNNPDLPPSDRDEDIWTATRASPTAAFIGAHRVDELSRDVLFEEPGWISNDGCAFYFSSNRGGRPHDLYVAYRAL
jgi:hypothetical protein